MMVKVCFVAYELSNIGGQQKILATVANELANYDDLDVSILLTAREDISKNISYDINKKINILFDKQIPRGNKDYLPQKILTKFHKKVFRIKNTKILRRILFPSKEIEIYEKFFKKNKFDIIIGVTPRIAAIISMLQINSKKIGWMHNTPERYFYLKNDAMWKEEAVYKNLFPNLDRMIVLTDRDKMQYKQVFNIDPIRIYNPLTFETKEKTDLNNTGILFIGRIYYQTKGIELLLKSLSILKKRNKKFKVNVVGDGTDLKRFKRDVKFLNLENEVTFHGSTQDVLSQYLQNSILVLPSIIEGFGLVVTEAMEAGLPVVSYRTEGPSEIISNKIDGFLIEKFDFNKFADSIELLMDDKMLKNEMRTNAIKKAQNFSINNIGAEWRKVLIGVMTD
ncbi:glycosyltransferase [Aerococcus urinaeequi]|uniref:glycosyltransferase n=1 Tax=Aerococcus urinaeequi TaxID=51665 RepID=UPI003D6C1DBA